MAHYDCDHCGEYMGIDYGICSACTPTWVKEAKDALDLKRSKIRDEVRSKYEERIDAEIAERMLELREEEDEFQLLYEAGKDWYKVNNTPP
jgi:hypothetical protein